MIYNYDEADRNLAIFKQGVLYFSKHTTFLHNVSDHLQYQYLIHI